MADSVRELIITAFCAALGSTGSPAEVHRSLTVALRKETLPAFVVEPSSEGIGAGEHEADERSLTIRVICVAGTTEEDGKLLDQVVDPLLSWVEQKVLTESFAGLANAAKATGITWAMEVSDQGYVGADIAIEVVYFTKRGDPTVSAA